VGRWQGPDTFGRAKDTVYIQEDFRHTADGLAQSVVVDLDGLTAWRIRYLNSTLTAGLAASTAATTADHCALWKTTSNETLCNRS
jgi:hypothetical protein